MTTQNFVRQILMKSWFILAVWAQVSWAQTLIDVNDVSYLWPSPIDVKEANDLVPLSKLIPEKVFHNLIGFSQGQKLQGTQLDTPLEVQDPVREISNWRLAAMRIDPCAPSPTSCLQEVRLVVQPLLAAEGLITHYDYALHIIFELSAGEPQNSEALSNLWKKLLQLKLQNKEFGIETTGIPLRTHPGFKRAGFRSQLQEITLAAIQKSKLKKITFIGAALAQGPWVFFQGLVKDESYILEADVSLNNQAFGHVIPMAPGYGGVLSPLPTNKNWPASEDQFFGPSVNDLFYEGILDLKKPAILSNQTESKVFKKEDIVHAIDNPKISNRMNTDCFSCHTVTSRTYLLELEKYDSVFRFKAPNNHTTLDAVVINKSTTNFRVFGWFGSRSVASQRVINESADVADKIEKLFASQLK
jgi:hypothetical protein